MIPVMNLDRQYKTIQSELDEAALEVLHSGQYILGEKVKEFEKNFATYCGTKYAIGVGNGTDALVIAMQACGIGPGDEVITCAMSFFSTAEAIAVVGATPVFVDADITTFTIDPMKIEEKITERTKAIVPIHLYGQCADMSAICEIAEKHGLQVIEDAAQAAGASYRDRKAGSLGKVACFSFFPTKNLGCAGDGGMILTDDEVVYKQCLALRVHGSGSNGLFTYGVRNNIDVNIDEIDFNGNLPKYFNFVLGHNSRLDALQAEILNIKLPYLDEWNMKRNEIAQSYSQNITNTLTKKPVCVAGNHHIYYVYVLLVEKRDAFRKYMEEKQIATGVYFPVPLHLQKVFEKLGYHEGDMPNAEYIAEHSVAIPMFAELTDEEINYIIKCINEFDK